MGRNVVDLVGEILGTPEIEGLIQELEAARITGRRGYGPRTHLGATFAKNLYALPTWSATASLIAEHGELQAVIGGKPSVHSLYRFRKRLCIDQRSILDAAISRLHTALREQFPALGCEIAGDATDLVAWSNGMRYLWKGGPERARYSDEDASWGHRSAVSTRKGGSYFGHKLHVLVDVPAELPLAWEVRTGADNESPIAMKLLDAIIANGFEPRSLALDKGYDSNANHDGCEARGLRPIIAMNPRTTKRDDENPYKLPKCGCGIWIHHGTDYKRKRAQYRCPSGKHGQTWLKPSRLHTLVPRGSRKWLKLYSGRTAVERVHARLKDRYGLTPLRVRGLERVALHVDLTMLVVLASRLARARAVPPAR
jgi:hypothetical protein